MIEVLVALVILAIGLLGVLSMQTRGLNSNQRAIFTTDVTLLANEMADHILAYYNNDVAVGNDFNNVSSDGNFPTGTDDFVKDAETQWVNAFFNDPSDNTSGNRLPSGRGDVTWDAGSSSYTITIRWDAERTGATGTDCDSPNDRDPVTDNLVNLTCYRLRVDL